MTRIEKLKERLPKDFGAAIVIDGHSRFYLTGFRSSAGALVVLPQGNFFLTDSRYIEMARRTVTGCEISEVTKFSESVGAILKKHGVKNCMMENTITVKMADQFKKDLDGVSIDLSDTLVEAVLACRELKDEAELKLIAKAQDISDTAFELTLKEIAVGMTEQELKLTLENHMRRLGADDIAFDTIAVSGANGSLPHGVPSDKKLQNGDLVTIDFGAKYKGYCTDITRTIAIGEIGEEQRKIYEVVKEAQETAVQNLRPGADCLEMDKIARDIITENGFGEMFRHGLGHSLGIEIHEEPRLSPTAKRTVMEGMVLTVEPGIYLPEKYGVRIEDSCVVTKDGCRPLSRITKELITIG